MVIYFVVLRNFVLMKPLSHKRFTTCITSVQYCRGCSVLWRLFSTVGARISTAGEASVLRKLFSTVLDSISIVGDSISTAGGQHHYCGGIASVLQRLFSIPQY